MSKHKSLSHVHSQCVDDARMGFRIIHNHITTINKGQASHAPHKHAREEFIISNAIKVHPLALLNYERLDDPVLKADIDRLTMGYTNKAQFFVDRLAQGVAMIAAAFYPKDVIVRLSDFKSNEYANLLGGRSYEPTEENPMLGFRGAARYYDPRYRAGFALECQAMRKVRDEMGLANVKLMIPFCRTVDEGRKVLAEMAKHGLRQGERGLEVYVMCEIPSNVILAEAFAEIFDGFSIGSNDLTQLVLGVDRDSAIVAHLFDERDSAVKTMIASVIKAAKATGRKIGICGQAPSDYPDFAQDNYAENTKLFWIGVIAGPSTFASLALDSGYKKGFQIPGPEARSEATRLQTRARRNW